MDRRRWGYLLVAAGLVLVVLSAAADAIGIGADDTGFGYRQVIGVIVGAIAFAIGLWLVYQARASTSSTVR